MLMALVGEYANNVKSGHGEVRMDEYRVHLGETVVILSLDNEYRVRAAQHEVHNHAGQIDEPSLVEGREGIVSRNRQRQ